MPERLAILAGVRTPFCKAGGPLAGHAADDLGALALREVLVRSPVPVDQIDEVILGCVAQPAEAANLARIAALKAGVPERIPAITVHRNCASGMEAISTAHTKIKAGEAQVLLVGGAESMSNIPLMYNRAMTGLFMKLMKAKTAPQRLAAWLGFRPSFLTPIVGVQVGLTDPVAGMNMGQTAELLAREFHITREAQDAFALASHQKAVAAAGRLAEELVPVPTAKQDTMVTADDGPRASQDLAALQKLKPYFDKLAGTVTVGNACPLTDGAVALVVTSESHAKALGVTPLGYVRASAYAGLDGKRMGLGPVYATAKLFRQTGLSLTDCDLVEINEAFSAQVLACVAAFASDDYAKKHLGQDAAIGVIDPQQLNVNGGAVALGHPVGATGARLVLTALKELGRRQQQRALCTLCIGGGQGAAFIVERT
jgi:acetyl-CoA C-acetyltransferase/acetyl-CoA acyltransferase